MKIEKRKQGNKEKMEPSKEEVKQRGGLEEKREGEERNKPRDMNRNEGRQEGKKE